MTHHLTSTRDTHTHAVVFSISGFTDSFTASGVVQVSVSKLFNQLYKPDKLKTPRNHSGRRTEDNNLEKVKEGKKDREWAEEKNLGTKIP